MCFWAVSNSKKINSHTAESSSRQILIVLSASQVIRRDPDLSNVDAKTPISESSEPGWTIVSMR